MWSSDSHFWMVEVLEKQQQKMPKSTSKYKIPFFIQSLPHWVTVKYAINVGDTGKKLVITNFEFNTLIDRWDVALDTLWELQRTSDYNLIEEKKVCYQLNINKLIFSVRLLFLCNKWYCLNKICIISEVLLHKLWALEAKLSECDRKLA